MEELVEHNPGPPNDMGRTTLVHVSTSRIARIPKEVAEHGARRLAWLAVGYAGLLVVMYALGSFVQPGLIAPAKAGNLYLVSMGAGLMAAAATAGLAFSGKLSGRLVLDLGLIFQVLGGLFLALLEHAIAWAPDAVLRGHSAVGIWIAFYVLVVPGTLGKTTLAALATAFMGPLGLAVHVVGGQPSPAAAQWVSLFFPTFLIAAGAVALSRRAHQMVAPQPTGSPEMGNYQLIHLLGRGGMGEVWWAQHRRLGRVAAVKLIRPEALRAESEEHVMAVRRRFEREAKATAALRSPHSVALYDFGVSENGSFYYVMELLEGMDLETFIQRFGPLPAARVIYFLLQALDALAEAHASGLTHRDIKPKNVFVCRLGFNYDFIKVLDFGLVQLQVSEIDSRLTREGTATGTPAYMAPEMSIGKGDVDARTDLYALGCLAYWLITGQLVFEATNPVGMALAHVQSTPAPPSQRTELEVPPELERLVLACLEKDPVNRPQSALDLAHALAAIPIEEPWSAQQAERWWAIHNPSVTFPV